MYLFWWKENPLFVWYIQYHLPPAPLQTSWSFILCQSHCPCNTNAERFTLELVESPKSLIQTLKGASMRQYQIWRGTDKAEVFDDLGERMCCLSRHPRYMIQLYYLMYVCEEEGMGKRPIFVIAWLPCDIFFSFCLLVSWIHAVLWSQGLSIHSTWENALLAKPLIRI